MRSEVRRETRLSMYRGMVVVGGSVTPFGDPHMVIDSAEPEPRDEVHTVSILK